MINQDPSFVPSHEARVRERLCFNTDWRFQRGELETTGSDSAVVQPAFDDTGWRMLSVPHDWGVEGSFDITLPGETGKLPWVGIGWYRKRFTVPEEDAGRSIALEIDGAMSFATVFLNGDRVGGWPYGYASWMLDLTPFVRYGAENVLAIRLENPPESSRWYPGGGIYRNVWLTKNSPLHVAYGGIHITTTAAGNTGQVHARVTVQNQHMAARTVRVVCTIVAANGQAVATTDAEVGVTAGASATTQLQLVVSDPVLWSLTEPHLYTLVTRIVDGDEVVDHIETPFGIRAIRWDAEEGFLLNGERVRLNGVCMHHDLGALGAAWNYRAAERQLEILREMGANALRTAHNPPAPELLDLCDRMGFLVIDEFSDTWKRPKKPNGYALLFDDWAERDVRAMVRRDRNHPCIIAWSIGNEVDEQADPEGHAVGRFLAAIVRQEDDTRPVTSGNNYESAGYNGFETTTEVFGYNYKPHEYGRFHATHPRIPLYGSETASTISSRGEYFFPVTEDKSGGESDFQMSSYDLYAPPWATTPDTEFAAQERNPFVAGEFVWTGFDYLGEPTPYNADPTILTNFADPVRRARAEEELQQRGRIAAPARSSYFGIVDLAGFPKDRFYLYQSHWRPDLPMVHILPHWNWPERVGQVTPVHVYTSGDEAELFLNGTSLGRRAKGPFEYRLRWDDVVYASGELHVVVTKNGKPWAESRVRTTGAPARLALDADRSRVAVDGTDLSFVTARIVDGAGQTVPRSHHRIRFAVSGPGEIVATDNGNPIDLTPFLSTERQAFNGLALVIVRASLGATGTITVTADSDGLTGGEASIEAG